MLFTQKTQSQCGNQSRKWHTMQTNQIYLPRNRRRCNLGERSYTNQPCLGTNIDFPCDTDNNETPVVTTKVLEDIQVYQSVTVRGMVLFGDRRAEPVPTKTDLIKREGSFVD